LSVPLRHHINGVFGNFYHQIIVFDDHLTAQARIGIYTPGFIQIVLLQLIGLWEAVKALANMHMTGGAGTGHFAGVLNIQSISQGGFTDSLALFGLYDSTLWAYLMMR
jgi:hypothetical protein